MTPHVLYCGDTSLDSAAAYLAGLMTRWNWSYDYLASDRPLPADALTGKHQLFVFSDYPAEQIASDVQERIVDQVRAGTGLLMIGGWESFHGLGGDWDGTPIGNALPVEIAAEDDRWNCDQPVLVRLVPDRPEPDRPARDRPEPAGHPVLASLPWSTRPPVIGGFNRFRPKPEGQTLLEAVLFRAVADGDAGGFRFSPEETHPLLVTGQQGNGRAAALATDVAPHWVGPMVDWGPNRVTARADGADSIEVGDLYETFFRSLLEWTCGS